MTSYSSVAATPPPPPLSSSSITHLIPTGAWTFYFHESEDKSWTIDSYKKIHSAASWEGMGTLLHEMGHARILGGVLKVMRGETSPLWENKMNIRGGAYCIRVPRKCAVDVFTRYIAGAAAGIVTASSSTNPIVGVTISPKRGFCIIKLWNVDAKAFNKPSDIVILHDEVKTEEILYRPHVEAPM